MYLGFATAMYQRTLQYDMDRSLDEFLDQSDTNLDQDARASHEPRDAESKTETKTKTKAENENKTKTEIETEMDSGAKSTMVWTADGTACENCSDVVRRRWRDDDQLVCTACKEW